jgi:hypothetical protein
MRISIEPVGVIRSEYLSSEGMPIQAAHSEAQGCVEQTFHLYERFRPGVPADKRGWGAKRVLDLAKIEALAQRATRQ